MEKAIVLKTIDTLQKLTAYLIGVNKDLNFNAFQKELKHVLNEVLNEAEKTVNPLDRDLISHFKTLHSLNRDLLKSISKELNVYYEIRHIPDHLSEIKRARGEFYDEISTHLYMFERNLETKPWGDLILNEHLCDQYTSYLINQNLQEENIKEKNALFSPKQFWPLNIEAFHVWARIHLLIEKRVIKSPFNLFASHSETYSELGNHYEMASQTIRNAYKGALIEIKALIENKRSSQNRPSYRQKQMKEVKDWLQREGYEDVALMIDE